MLAMLPTIRLNSTLSWMFIAIGLFLALGSIARLVALRHADAQLRRKRLASLRTWWLLALLLAAVVAAGQAGVCLAMAATSGLAWHEYVRLIRPGTTDRWVVRIGYLTIPVQYALIYCGWSLAAMVTIPVGGLVLLAVVRIIADDPDDYVCGIAGLAWGLLVLVYALSYTALAAMLPETSNPIASPIGWFLYLVLLTQTNDIAQALIGRRFGAHKRHRIAPRMSPNKTWEGFIGGLLFTTAIAVVLAPVLTTLPQQAIPFGKNVLLAHFFWPAFAGFLIAVSGFFGDLNMSGVKRDCGVKDSGQLLPGMGGMIDRIDSLTFAAPLYYFLIYGLVL